MRRKTSSPQRYRLRNGHDYNAVLVGRGSLTLWCDEAALASWVERERPHRRGRPRTYSDLAITCMLTLKAVYHPPLRATEGLTRSLLQLLGVALPVLLAAVPAPVAQVTGDGSYDEWRCWAAAARPEHPRAVFRLRHGPKSSAPSRQHGNSARPPLERDEHVRRIRQVGRARWKAETHITSARSPRPPWGV